MGRRYHEEAVTPVNDDWTTGDDDRIGTNLDDVFMYHSNTGHDRFIGGLGLDEIQLQDNPFTSANLTLRIGGMSSIEIISNLDDSAANITVLGQADFRDVVWSGDWTGSITGSFIDDLIYLGTYPGSGSNHVITVNAAEGDDVIFGTSLDYADVTIHGGAGNDVIQSLPRDTSTYDGDFKYYGDAGNDTILGWEDDDYINGGNGEDDIFGLGGDDTLIGGADADDFFTNWYTVGWNTYTGGDGVISDTSTNRIIFQEWEDFSPSQHRIKIAGWSDIDQAINTASTELYLQFQGSFNLTGIALQNITGAEAGAGDDTIVGTGVIDTTLNAYRGMILDGKAATTRSSAHLTVTCCSGMPEMIFFKGAAGMTC
jgi:hypothetical protein